MPGADAVAVTGLGVVSPHGADAAAMFDALMHGESAVHPIFPTLEKPAAAAAVRAFDVARWFSKLQLTGVDRVSQLAVAAADLAMTDAKLAAGSVEPARLGVYLGCGMGGAGSLESAYLGSREKGRVPPLTVPAFMPNAPAAHVAMRQRAQGPAMTYSVACASSSVAIAEAAKAVQRGEVDVALAGGAEALLVPGVVTAWQAMQTLASFPAGDAAAAAAACKPFAAERSGFVLGEGAAFLVLEQPARARSRQAEAYALLAGWGLSCDATHLTKPDPAGQQRALKAALVMAGLEPAQVGYCNAHGTATRVGDPVEAQALAGVWGQALCGLAVSSTKALHGHLLGAAGALEAAITVLALHQRRLPPNAHVARAADDCPLRLVLEAGTEAPSLHAAISSSFAFGGTNSTLLFTRA